METKTPSGNNDKPVTTSGRIQDLLDRYKWSYLLGWLFIAGFALLIELVGPSLFQNLSTMVGFIAPTATLFGKIVLSLLLLLIVPLAAGWLGGILLKFMDGRRNVQALRTMQEKLFAEVKEGSSREFPVVLANTPNANVRSLAVVTSRFKEASGDRELAAVYLPGTPDPTRGTLRIIAVEELTFTEWSVENLTDFHVTFGSLSPDSC